MERLRYFVVRHRGRWTILHKGYRYGPYKNQLSATKATINAANSDGGKGRLAQVLLQGINGQFRREWTFGKDPYPPSG